VGPLSDLTRLQMPPAVVNALLHELRQVDNLSARLHVLVLQPAPPRSPASVETNDKLQAMGHDLAATYLAAALDHVHAWRTLLHAGKVPSYAHFSLLRTAHESALIALWLLEPGLSADERRARGVAAQLADYEERRKLEEDMMVSAVPPPAQTAAQRQAHLLTLAKQHGLTRPNKKGEAVLTTPMPSTVELFTRFEPVSRHPKAKGSYLYRFYSGYAHAKQWALTQGAQRMAPFDAAGRTVALVPGNDEATLAATQRTMNAIERAMVAYESLHQPVTPNSKNSLTSAG
jgi:hypothetical protein